MTIAIQAALGFLVGFFLVAAGQRGRRRIEARILPSECRACGCEPSHENVGTWGGLIPIEDTYACGGGVVRGSAGVFLCAECYVEVGTEVTLFFRELSARPYECTRNRPPPPPTPRKTYPEEERATPQNMWGEWLL